MHLHGGATMKIISNLAMCQGHARCQQCCPEVFSTDERFGKVVLLLPDVPSELQENAALAVNNCPEGALSIAEE